MEQETIYVPPTQRAIDHAILNSVGMAVAMGVIGLRLSVRHFGIGIGWDDGLMVVGFVVAAGFFGIVSSWITLGMGYNLDPNSPLYLTLMNNLPSIYKGLLVAQVLYVTSLTAMKLSVLMFYLRIFTVRILQIATKVFIGGIICWGVAFILYMLLVCRPIEANWIFTMTPTNCGDQIAMYTSLIALNMITDFFIMVFPLYTIWNLQMRTAEKLALTISFCLGFTVIALGAVRLHALYDLALAANLTGTVEQTVFLATMELWFNSLALSIPTLRPLYRQLREKWSGSNIDRSGANSYMPNTSDPLSRRSKRKGAFTDATATYLEMDDCESLKDKSGADDSVVGHFPQVDDASSEKNLTNNPDKIKVTTRWTVSHNS
ncbi:hypothetical protein P171DRAFT_378100 [Karstenula rhodostoma CBS 690.94]|uniref:Rhodopsin domain-containing protein n=1 Tax=Karstenula rhodostoma CBS 690.94 TaxID=1392251 RepID=A0A9P4PSY0_9PLEO|nr:hypothetical protein P171DRAFT_378100 [Karstenula rhodostoma CBS 690.94]